ncbi:lysozyme g-like [Bufo bufo]|uniref:lysozyme g-like n=1 Tax=Bufo bufo TaxID=8384 RepID=UPI001ABDB262|nr:lysozyme g-like [Bufo bufo]
MASRYGNLDTIQCSGASETTGRQDRENYSGVFASERLAKTDLERMKRHKPKIQSASSRTGIPAPIIAGIVSRESRAGNALDGNGYGDHGNAFGLMQIDRRWHTPRGAFDSEEHILQGTEILCSMFNVIQQKFPQWTANQHMQGALAAYNMGPDSVTSFNTVDSRTTDGDYSNDVLARAKYYKRSGF